MKRLVTTILAAILMIAMALPAFAAPEPGPYRYADWSGTVKGQQVTLKKYYLTNASADVLNVDFTYDMTVPEGHGNAGRIYLDATDDTPVVYVGVGSNVVKFGGDATGAAGSMKGTLAFRETDNASKMPGPLPNHPNVDQDLYYVEKDIVVDFTDVIYYEPGIYRYWLKESSNNPATLNDVEVTGDANTWRTIDAYVTDVTDDHKLQITYVVYEGKLTTPPKILPDAYSETEDYDPSRELSVNNIATTDWTYVVKAPNGYQSGSDTYVYNYVKDEFVSWGWQETMTRGATGEQFIRRDRMTYLDKAFGETGQTYIAGTYGEAIAMGADNADIHGSDLTKGVRWIYNEDGVTHTYVWDATNEKWIHEVVDESGARVNAPDPNAKATVTIVYSTPVQEEYTYAQAKATENYIDRELTKYEWVLKDETNPNKKTTYTYDASEKNWKVKVEDKDDSQPDPEAVPADNAVLSFNKILFSYVDALERAAQLKAGYEIKATSGTPNGAEAGVKSDNYVNQYEAFDLEFSKTVGGNQGSRDRYFKFTVDIKAPATSGGATLKIDNTKLSVKGGSVTNTGKINLESPYTSAEIIEANRKTGVTLEADGSLKDPLVFYLRDGDSVKITGVPKDSSYEITEVDANTEGYKASFTIEGNDLVTMDGTADEAEIKDEKDGKAADTNLRGDVRAKFRNDRDGVIPTGVMIGIGGALVLIAAAVGYFFLRRKMRVEED